MAEPSASSIARWHTPLRTILCGLLLTASTVMRANAIDTTCTVDARNLANVPLPVIGRDAMPSELAVSLQRSFNLIHRDYRYAEAYRSFAQAIGQAHGNLCVEALADFGLAQAIRSLRMGDALPLYRRAETLFETLAAPMALAHVHQRIATTEYLLGDHAAYRRDDAEVPAEFDAAGDHASALMERGLQLGLAEQPAQPAQLEELVRQLEALDSPNDTGVRGTLQFQWADAYQQAGQFREAMAHERLAVAALQACDCSPQTLGSAWLDMARMASKEDPTAVLEYARQGDAIYRRAHLEPYRPRSLRILGAAYSQIGRYPLAIQTYRQALALAQRQHAGHMIPGIAVTLAQAYDKAGAPATGIALLTLPDLRPLTPWDRCQYQATTAELLLDAHRNAEADDLVRRIADTCETLFSPLDVATLEYVFSQAELRAGQLDSALRHGQIAVDTIERERTLISSTDRTMNGYNEGHARYFDGLIHVLLALHRPEQALLVSEQFRARPFLDLVNSRTATPSALPQSVPIDFTLPERAGQLNLRSEAHPFTLTPADIRATVEAQHATLISYWLSRNRIVTWVVAPGRPVFALDRPLREATLNRLVRATLPQEQAAGAQPWHTLYRLLLAPIERQLPSEPGALLTIIPQGALFQLSFPALQNTRGRYLIERYAIHTVPAAGVLQVTARNERDSATHPTHYLLVASPERLPQAAGHALPPLPGAAEEVRGIRRQLREEDVTLLEGRRAAIDSLIAELPGTTVLHLATHAVLDDDAPLQSYLALDRSQRGGMLTAGLVYGLHLNTSLVVLSACSTGRGRISGDGVAGLSRAFFYAGAASLVTTLWDVADEPTARLMPRFYAALASGRSRSQSLREAQLSLLEDLRRHRIQASTTTGTKLTLPPSPEYWAAFSLTGQP